MVARELGASNSPHMRNCVQVSKHVALSKAAVDLHGAGEEVRAPPSQSDCSISLGP